MIWMVVATAVFLSALMLMGVRVAATKVAAAAEHDDQPGVRSAVTFELLRDEAALPSLLDRVHAALENAGADASSFAAKGAGFELDGMLGADGFRVTLAPIDPDDDEELPSSFRGFLLLLHARTLGRYRYVAPPATETTKSLLEALDVALRASPEVNHVAWRSRQDQVADAGE